MTDLEKSRLAITASFASFGAMVGTFSGSVPQLIANHGLDNATYGFGVTLMSLTTVAAMSISGLLTRYLSHRAILLAVLPSFLLLLLLLLGKGTVPVFLGIVMLYGIGAGLLDVIMNAEGGLIEVRMKRPIYTGLHGSASLGVTVFAIASSFLSTRYGTPVSVAFAGIVVATAFVLIFLHVPAAPLPEPMRRAADAPRPAVFTRRLLLIGIAAGFIISCEVTALFWSSQLLAEGAPQLAAISGAGAAFFALSNAVLRFPGDRLRARFGDFRLMTVTIVIGMVGFAGLAFTTDFAVNVFFFALVGIGVAVLCPCLFAMAGHETPQNRAAGLGVAMLIAGVPRIAIPTIFGALSDMLSTRTAFGICAIFLLVALVAIRALAAMPSRAAAAQHAG